MLWLRLNFRDYNFQKNRRDRRTDEGTLSKKANAGICYKQSGNYKHVRQANFKESFGFCEGDLNGISKYRLDGSKNRIKSF